MKHGKIKERMFLVGPVAQACNLSTWEVEAGRSEIQGHSWLYKEFRLAWTRDSATKINQPTRRDLAVGQLSERCKGMEGKARRFWNGT